MKKVGMLMASLLVGLSAAAASAATPVDSSTAGAINPKKLTWNGVGCPSAGRPLRVQYNAKTGKLTVGMREMAVNLRDRSVDYKSCTLAMPVEVPAGKRIVLERPTVYGHARLENGATVRAQAEVFFAGQEGLRVVAKMAGATSGSARFYERLEQGVAPPCGRSGIVRANTSLQGRTTATSSAKVSLEGVSFDVRLEACPQSEDASR